MSKLRLDHIGIVVKNLHKTAAAFENAIGLPLEEVENYKEMLNVGFVPVGSMDIEFLEPTTSEGLNADFLKDNGEGVHHIAFEVEDLDAAVANAVRNGVRVLLGPTEGARGKRIVFLDGISLGGTIVELLESPQPTDQQ